MPPVVVPPPPLLIALLVPLLQSGGRELPPHLEAEARVAPEVRVRVNRLRQLRRLLGLLDDSPNPNPNPNQHV